MSKLSRLAAVAVCAAAAASVVHAQRVQSVPSSPPSATQRTTQAAPNPAGLTPVFPAGISSGSGAAVSRDPLARSNSPLPPGDNAVPQQPPLAGSGGGVIGPGVGVGVGGTVNTAVMGAGSTVRGPGQLVEGGAGGFSATDVARSFFFADADKDGDLTRAEAARLSIQSLSFEEMDRNFDGIISRFEYNDSVR